MNKIKNKKIIKKVINFILYPSFTSLIFVVLYFGYAYLKPEFSERDLEQYVDKVIDGDTIVLQGVKIRLKGLDAPELRQKCVHKKNNMNVDYNCGIEAKQHLEQMILGNIISCTNEGKDRYQRQLGYCFVQYKNINRQMVRDGYGVVDRRYDKTFILDELYAKSSKKGIWRGEFEALDEHIVNRGEWQGNNFDDEL